MKENDITVSVIIPVYEVEEWIERFINSLKAQSLSGLEFIFVDDCGNDGTMDIINKFKEEDNRVIIIHNEKNIGPGSSRNKGIEIARGEYLSFLDPDDYISDNFYTSLYTCAKKTKKMIVKCEKVLVNISSSKVHRGTLSNSLIASELSSGKPLYTLFKYEHSTAIYKKELFTDGIVRYGDTYYSEDALFLLKCCSRTNSITFVNNAKYYYNIHTSSITSISNLERTEQELKSFENIVAYLSTMSLDVHLISYLINRINYYTNRLYICFKDNEVNKQVQQEYINKFIEIINSIPKALNDLNSDFDISYLLSKKELIPSITYTFDNKETPLLDTMGNILQTNREISNRYIARFNKAYLDTYFAYLNKKSKRKKPIKYSKYIHTLSVKKKALSYVLFSGYLIKHTLLKIKKAI